MVAVARQDAGPVAVVRLCDNDRLNAITVTEFVETTEPPSVPLASILWDLVNLSDQRRSPTIPFGTTPSGWKAQTSTPFELSSGKRYQLDVDASGRLVNAVLFTRSDFEALEPDQVLTVDAGGYGATTMPLPAFERRAKESC
ncbi:hypothetical protein [Dactylosporangium salmoneum]|uniref:hypothetical protein n=1 Tax=Dactylosporangium salmoneum TaxID=53361 RepID=UPI0031D8FC5B